jgi:hypothetical protein
VLSKSSDNPLFYGLPAEPGLFREKRRDAIRCLATTHSRICAEIDGKQQKSRRSGAHLACRPCRALARESQMERFRNMEAVLMLLFGGVCAAACVVDPQARSRAPLVSAGPVVPMAVVVITGKRLTPARKRAEIAAENARAG